MLRYTVGELIDRLIICHLKYWHMEEKISEANISKEEIGKISRQMDSLNKFRNKIIESLNEFFKEENRP